MPDTILPVFLLTTLVYIMIGSWLLRWLWSITLPELFGFQTI